MQWADKPGGPQEATHAQVPESQLLHGLTSTAGLAHLPALTVLNLEYCEELTNLAGLENLPALKSLNPESCTALMNVSHLAGLPALESIVLTSCTSLTSLVGVANLPALTSIDLDYCRGLRVSQDLRICRPGIHETRHLSALTVLDTSYYKASTCESIACSMLPPATEVRFLANHSTS